MYMIFFCSRNTTSPKNRSLPTSPYPGATKSYGAGASPAKRMKQIDAIRTQTFDRIESMISGKPGASPKEQKCS